MIQAKNTLFQPLTYALKSGKSIHFKPRETKMVPQIEWSEELEKAAQRNLLLAVAVSTRQDATPQTVSKTSKRKRG